MRLIDADALYNALNDAGCSYSKEIQGDVWKTR